MPELPRQLARQSGKGWFCGDPCQYGCAFLEKADQSVSGQLHCRQAPRQGGVILARASSREQVAAWLTEDPFHQTDLANYEIVGWLPGLRHRDVPVDLVPDAIIVED